MHPSQNKLLEINQPSPVTAANHFHFICSLRAFSSDQVNGATSQRRSQRRACPSLSDQQNRASGSAESTQHAPHGLDAWMENRPACHERGVIRGLLDKIWHALLRLVLITSSGAAWRAGASISRILLSRLSVRRDCQFLQASLSFRI